MTGKRATLLLLLIAGLFGSPAPSAAWELVTHWRLTEAAINNALTESTGLVAYLARERSYPSIPATPRASHAAPVVREGFPEHEHSCASS
jgi:hypothetical protein